MRVFGEKERVVGDRGRERGVIEELAYRDLEHLSVGRCV